MAMILLLDMASMKLTNAITIAMGSSDTLLSQLNSGKLKAGRPCGTSPTTLPPMASKPTR